jgi:hypothetical protein
VGGGVSGTGGGGGSVGVGGGSSQSQGGIVTFDTVAFFKPAIVASADGAVHLLFSLNTSPSTVQYARCAADCGVGSNWAVVILGSGQFTGSTRLAVGTDNRVHVIYETSGTGIPTELVYATCISDCAQPGSWTKTNLASLFDGAWSSPSNGKPLAIDSQNRLSFTVDRSSYTNGGLSLATCAADCTNLANWTTGKIRAGGARTALVARGTTLHQLVDNATGSANGTALAYRTCAGNCTAEASWQELSNYWAYDGARPLAIAVTAQGGVRIAYNQGVADASESAAVKAQDNKLLFWSCDTNCTQGPSWDGLVLGPVDDGSNGVAMVEQGGKLVLSVSNSAKVYAAACSQDCLNASSWLTGDIDTTEAMTLAYDPYTYTGSTCSGVRPISATWHLENGVVALRPDGSAAFAHAVYVLRQCVASTGVAYIPGFGRVVYLPQ